MTTNPCPGTFRTELDTLVAVSTPHEGVSLPVGPTTRNVAAATLCCPVLLLVYLSLAHHLAGISWVNRWGLAERALSWALLESHRTSAVAVAVTLVVAGLALAYLTDGFRVAGPRLQKILFGSGFVATSTAVPPIVGILVVVVVAVAYLVVFALMIALGLFVVGALFVALLNS